MKAKSTKSGLPALLAALTLAATVSSTGCQITEAGQTLPSPWYILDDVEYFAPGTEFKLPREAASLQQSRAEQDLQN